jgi:hypothetical protein
MWQRFVIGSALLFGVLLGVAGSIFGYSNLSAVDVRWSVFHLDGIPLWTVAIVPVATVLVAGTIYHWYNSLYHFTEHMRHRHRVHELEAELTRVRAQLDQLLEMPGDTTSGVPANHTEVEVDADGPEATPAPPSPVASNGVHETLRKTSTRKRVPLEPAASEPEHVAAPTNGRAQAEPIQEPAQEP